MTEGSEVPPQRNSSPGKSIKKELLVLGMLLVAIAIIFALIYWQGLVPDLLLPATPTPAATSAADTSLPATTPAGFTALVETLTAGPRVETMTSAALDETMAAAALEETPVDEPSFDETPIETETPTLPMTLGPSQTPAYGACQYTLKEGPANFLYAIYWNWHINKNIRDVEDFYLRIHCAALLTNLKCDYHPGDPDSLQPGWTLVLPGVTDSICTLHGGIPVP
jgi:hypothetical protein